MNKISTRHIAVTGILATVASVLMYVNFALPFAPPYLKIDFSDFPALIAAFAVNPISGVAVCLIKNIISLFATTTGGVGELSNFLLSSSFVLVSGLIYRRNKTKKTARIACLVGAVLMAVISIFTNYFLVYPAYTRIMPVETIIGMSSSIIPYIDSVLKVILIFNAPFTLMKGLLNAVLTFAVYKRLSPIIRGKR